MVRCLPAVLLSLGLSACCCLPFGESASTSAASSTAVDTPDAASQAVIPPAASATPELPPAAPIPDGKAASLYFHTALMGFDREPGFVLKGGDALFALAMLDAAPDKLLDVSGPEVTFVYSLEQDGRVIAQHRTSLATKTIRGGGAGWRFTMIPTPDNPRDGDWTGTFAKAFAALPPGRHLLTVKLESPSATPPLLAWGTLTVDTTAGPRDWEKDAVFADTPPPLPPRAAGGGKSGSGGVAFYARNNCPNTGTATVTAPDGTQKSFRIGMDGVNLEGPAGSTLSLVGVDGRVFTPAERTFRQALDGRTAMLCQ
jgi:hypothetical protein